MKQTHAAVIFALAVTLLAGCTTSTPSSSKNPIATASAPRSAASPVLYTSSAFAAPLTVELDPSLDPTPIEDSAGLLTWGQSGNDINRIRFIILAKVYTQRGAEQDPGPYAAYLQTLISQGVKFSKQGAVTVDGEPVPIVTANAANDVVDGDIGCSSTDADQSDPDHCFAFGPDFSIRVVSFVHGGKTIVAWARSSPTKVDTAFNTLFETMLGTVTFR